MDDTQNTILETEWSHFVDVNRLDAGTTKLSISPDEEARKRLAQRLGLVELKDLKADLEIKHNPGDAAFYVKGAILAHVQQNCVVSMAPLENEVRDEFDAWYADPEAAVSIAKARHEKLTEKGHGEQPILDERDDPEALIDGKMDLGELITQYLSLAVDPYPHAEGVEFEAPASAEEDNNDAKNPFAALKDWKDKLSSGENG